MNRREFITLLGGVTAAWPLAARAQQPTIPMIGFLSIGSQQSDVWRLAAFRRGLSETGYIEGRNVVSEFRWAHDQYDRLPTLATELARSRPSVIVAVGGPAAAHAGRGRLQVQIRRAFDTSRGVLSTSQIFDWTYASHRAYGQRIPCWHRWSVSRILRQIGEPIGRADTIGRPWLRRLKTRAADKSSAPSG